MVADLTLGHLLGRMVPVEHEHRKKIFDASCVPLGFLKSSQELLQDLGPDPQPLADGPGGSLVLLYELQVMLGMPLVVSGQSEQGKP